MKKTSDTNNDIMRARNILAAIASHGYRMQDAKDTLNFLDSTAHYGPTDHIPDRDGCHSCGAPQVYFEICDDCMTKLNRIS